LAAAHIQEARYNEARTAVLKALELDPELAVGLFNLSMCDAVDGRYHEAISLYRKILELDSNFSVVRGNLIFCIDLLAKTTPEEALEERLAWRRTWPGKPNFSFEHLDRSPDRPLRVGFVTAQWMVHSL